MRVNGAWIKGYCVLCSKTYDTLHSCHNFPLGSRQATRGNRICETSLLIGFRSRGTTIANMYTTFITKHGYFYIQLFWVRKLWLSIYHLPLRLSCFIQWCVISNVLYRVLTLFFSTMVVRLWRSRVKKWVEPSTFLHDISDKIKIYIIYYYIFTQKNTVKHWFTK